MAAIATFLGIKPKGDCEPRPAQERERKLAGVEALLADIAVQPEESARALETA